MFFFFCSLNALFEVQVEAEVEEGSKTVKKRKGFG